MFQILQLLTDGGPNLYRLCYDLDKTFEVLYHIMYVDKLPLCFHVEMRTSLLAPTVVVAVTAQLIIRTFPMYQQ